MTIKKADADNSLTAADDILDDCLDKLIAIHHRRHSETVAPSTDVMTAFALLYIADKLDSIDTRLLRLVKLGEQCHD